MATLKTKFIFVYGGVLSGVGKGVTSASLAALMKAQGFRVSAVKIDPYVNVDAGTMNPTEHGEVFVTIDGDETDQDVGNYERFLNQNITRDNYMTTGRVYLSVIQQERNLGFHGKCVDVVPHIPLEVISRLEKAATVTKAEIMIVEIGGTVGEYQNILFVEAARRLQIKYPGAVAHLLVSYLPIPNNLGEMKTKPTQYAVRTLNSSGIQPDFIICRGSQSLDEERREKLAISSNVPADHIISAPDVESIYEVPLLFDKAGLAQTLFKHLGLKPRRKNIQPWKSLVQRIKHPKRTIKVAVIGKYFATGDFVLADVYISVIEALKHAAWAQQAKVELHWIQADDYEAKPSKLKELSQYDGIVIPGGFGKRGIEGKILAAKYARTHNIPYLGLCYGMQIAVIEYARHVAKLSGAQTQEIDPKAKHQVIHIMPDQAEKLAKKQYGNSMRLGSWDCVLDPKSVSYAAYKQKKISERHRHRYEFNNDYRDILVKAGLRIAGTSPDGKLVEIIEVPNHPFFVGVQFHPEFQSRPLQPHPLFMAFMKACGGKKKVVSPPKADPPRAERKVKGEGRKGKKK